MKLVTWPDSYFYYSVVNQVPLSYFKINHVSLSRTTTARGKLSHILPLFYYSRLGQSPIYFVSPDYEARKVRFYIFFLLCQHIGLNQINDYSRIKVPKCIESIENLSAEDNRDCNLIEKNEKKPDEEVFLFVKSNPHSSEQAISILNQI